MTTTISCAATSAFFLDAHNFARRRKTLSGLTRKEYICKTWT